MHTSGSVTDYDVRLACTDADTLRIEGGILQVGAHKVLDASNRDVANGVVGLDASLNAEIAGTIHAGNLSLVNSAGKLLFSADKYIYEDAADGEAIKLRLHKSQGHPAFIIEDNEGVAKHTLNAGSIPSATFTGTVTADGLQIENGNIDTGTGSTTTNQIISTQNGLGKNIKVGNDAWIGDVNVANMFGIRGVPDETMGGIVFGSALDTNLYRSAANVLKTDDSFECIKTTVNATKPTVELSDTSTSTKGSVVYDGATDSIDFVFG